MISTAEPSVIILGSGTCVPSLKRSAASALILLDGVRFLVDAGPGTMWRLLETGTTIFDISFILLTHFHPDHTGELASFLFATKYPDPAQRQTPLTIVAGKGFSDFFGKLKNVYGSWIELAPGLLNLKEMDSHGPDVCRVKGVTVESMPMRHRDESIAYRLTGPDGLSIVYSGDTDYCENLVILAENADLLICESALPDAMKVEGHLTPSLAGDIASRAHVRQLVLTHFYPECDHADLVHECRKTYSGPLVIAQDLMKIRIPAPFPGGVESFVPV